MTTYIHFTEEQKQRANEVDLVDFLEMHGEKLLRSGREKRLASDRSITVRGNRWYDHEKERGGLSIDFLQEYYGLSFPDAVNKLLGGGQGKIYRVADIKEEKRKPFKLPNRNTDMRRVFAYLIKNRHIDRDIISFFAKEKMLYESCELSKNKTKEYHNAVFVGYDENKVPRHAHKHGVYTRGKSFKGNVDSCDPGYSFNYIGKSNRLYVFEAPIDMLSFVTMYQENWEQHSYVSLCGVSEQAMEKLLEVNPKLTHVILCLDHDATGIETSEKFSDILADKKIKCDKLVPKYKDWNEDLKARFNLQAAPAEEHPQYILRDEIFLEIDSLTSELKNIDYSFSKLNSLFSKCKISNTEQMVESLKQLSALSLFAARKEYRQINSNKGLVEVKKNLYYSFKAYENRSRINISLDMIKNDLININKSQGIISKKEKISIAESYENIAKNCLKAIVLIELKEQKKEQKQIKGMIMQ